jgi:hypothetical protein
VSPELIFQIHLVLGYVAWLLCFGVYIWPRLKAVDHFEAQRAIATLHSFRFFGLVFILPGVVSPNLSASFAAYWDFATGVLAMLALLTVRIRPLFWLFVVAFNLVGFVDLILDYTHAVQVDLPAKAGELGATYAIPIIYVPLLMITHIAAFYLLVRPQNALGRGLISGTHRIWPEKQGRRTASAAVHLCYAYASVDVDRRAYCEIIQSCR